MRSIVSVLILSAAMSVPAAGQTVRGAERRPPDSTPADSAAYYFLLGRHFEAMGEGEQAIAAHKQAIQLAPASAELRAELAGVYARQERAADAVAAAEEALKYDERNREANRVLGSIYAALADQRRPLKPGDDPQLYVPRAIAALERARQEGRQDLGMDLTLGRLYLQTRAYDKAVPLLTRVTAEQPGYTEAALLLASAHEGAGRTDEAIDVLRRGLAENPRFFRGLVMLGELHEKQGQWAEAAKLYERAQQVNVRGADLSTRRAAALINAGEPAAARDLLRTAAAQPDAQPLLLYLFAAAQRQSGDLAGAEATARRLRTAAPDDPRGLYVLAQVLEARGDAAGAERSLREILDRDPRDATALNHLGYMLAERGERLEEAVDLVRRALAIEPGNPSFLDSLGWAYYRQGKLDLADTPLTEAASKLPRNSVVQDHLGDLRIRQNRVPDAVAAWERALSGDGDSVDPEKIRRKILDAKARMEGR